MGQCIALSDMGLGVCGGGALNFFLAPSRYYAELALDKEFYNCLCWDVPEQLH